jgi:tetratricopeptide (TPR) repeat protein
MDFAMTRPFRLRPRLRLAAACLLLPGLLLASPLQDPGTELLRGATMWNAKNRPDIARQLVEKLLAIHPDSPDGLVFLADLALRENKPAEARKILDNLRARQPGHRATRDLETLMRVYGPEREKLARMRLMAREGHKTDAVQLARIRNAETVQLARDRKVEAVKLARELFPNGPPLVGGLALEYFQILSDSPRDAGAAASQLAQLYKETGDARYRLAQLEMKLSQSGRPTTLLRDLESLSLQPDVNQQSLQDLWRRALDRLNNSSASSVWIKNFLKRFPGDPAMVERLAALQLAVERAERIAHSPANLARHAARSALDQGQLDLAETELQTVLSARPRDAESTGNLGLVRLRQGRHSEALDLFTRADRLEPQRKWKTLQSTARFWGLLRQADLAIERHDLTAAAGHAVEATRLQPGNVEALITLASVRLLTGDMELAQELYLRVLKQEPGNSSALKALANLYGQLGRPEQALALLAQAVAHDPGLSVALANTRADHLATQAQAQIEAKRLSPAQRSLESAVLLAPKNAWIRYSLARLYQRLDMVNEAIGVMNDGVTRDPTNIEMRHARALIRSALDDDAGTVEDLEQIPPAQQSVSMHELAQRTWVRLRVAQAQQPAQRVQAERLLASAEALAKDDPDLLLAVANAWFRLGQPALAVAVFDRLASRQPALSPAADLQYAVLLNRAHYDAALDKVLPGLLSLPGWTPQQELKLLELYTDHQERLIQQQRLAGNSAQAIRLAQTPLPNPEAKDLALRRRTHARLLLAAGDYREAAQLIEQALPDRPDDLDMRLDLGNAQARQGQLAAALEQAHWLGTHIPEDDVTRRLALLRLWQRAQSIGAARAESSRLLKRYPDDPSVLQHAARLERTDGQYAVAVALFRRARQLESGGTPAAAAPQAPISPPATLEMGEALPQPALHFAHQWPSLEARPPAATHPVANHDPHPNLLAEITPAATSLRLNKGLGLAAEHPLTLVWASAPAPRHEDPGAVSATTSPIQVEIDALEARRQTWIEMGQQALHKDATSGLSNLKGWERPVVAWIPRRYDGHYFIHLDQVSLSAGSLPVGNTDEVDFGQLPTLPLASYPLDSADKAAHGFNLGVGFEGDHLSWDVGSIGIGFPVSNLVGGIRQSDSVGTYNYKLELSRRPLTGSLLSYAGTHDPVTGEVWGGVVATGVSGRVATDIGPYSASISTNYALLSGRHVQDNTRLQLRAAVDRDLYNRPDHLLNVGLTLSAWRFEHDLSQFTWGHGGYYSPQSYLSLALPVEWSGRQGPFTWLVRGSVSVSRSSSEASDYFPGNPSLQTKAKDQAGVASPVYPGGDSTGVGYSLRGVFEYQVTPQTALGAQLELDRSESYSPTNLLLYARYLFGPVVAPVTNRPRPIQTYSSF